MENLKSQLPRMFLKTEGSEAAPTTLMHFNLNTIRNRKKTKMPPCKEKGEHHPAVSTSKTKDKGDFPT